MKDIKWIKSCRTAYIKSKKISYYKARVGDLYLSCRPEIKHPYNYENRAYICGWKCSIYFDGKWIADVRTNRTYKHDRPSFSLKLCQENAERLAVKYLRGYSLLMLKQLKRTGLLEEMLSEVGVEL